MEKKCNGRKKMRLLAHRKLALCIALFLWAVTNAQGGSKMLSLHLKDATIQEACSAIEKLSDYRFSYLESNLKQHDRRITFSVTNATIYQLMDKVVAGSTLKYTIKGQMIFLKSEAPMKKGVAEEKGPGGIRGRVVDEETKAPLRGATVLVGSRSVVTDADGMFSLSLPPGEYTLEISYVGYEVKKMTGIRVSDDETQQLTFQVRKYQRSMDNVVVTALGVERRKRTLSYATQNVDMQSLTVVRDPSLGSSLIGKVAGVDISSSSGATGVGGSSRIVIRGNRSINGNNQPMIVVDGIPYTNDGGALTLYKQTDRTDGLSNINPDDVESINVLKGPAASALYGSSANNGVLVITTRKGRKGQSKVSLNSIATIDHPYLYPDLQNEYGQGAGGAFISNSDINSWGPRMTGQKVTDWTGKETSLSSQPNNVRDLFRNGYNFTNTISYTGGGEKSTVYFSYSNTAAKGIIQSDRLQRHNLNLRLTAEPLDKLHFDFKLTGLYQHLSNRLSYGDSYYSPMNQLIEMPRSLRTADIAQFEHVTPDGFLKQNTWAPGSTAILNPYWAMYRGVTPETRARINGLVSLKYDLFHDLSFQARGGFDIRNDDGEEMLYWDAVYVQNGKGDYYTSFNKYLNLNSDVLLSYNKSVTKDLRINIMAGAEIRDTRSRAQSSHAQGLSIQNKFSLNNGMAPVTSDGASHVQTQSVYGMMQLSWRNYLFLDGTLRNDWNSTLPPPYRYSYPSVGITNVISDMVKLPELISFAKVRASYAEVGNGASFAQIFQTYSRTASGPVGMLSPSSSKAPVGLIPEKTKSWEAGLELAALDSRLSLDVTLYKSNTYHQLLSVVSPPTSGYSSNWINTGNIQNKGLEVVLSGAPYKGEKFGWDINLNFAVNRNKVVALTPGVIKYEMSGSDLAMGSDWAVVGKPFGEMYGRGYVRNANGQVLIDSLGIPKMTTGDDVYLGNFNYDWTSSIVNSFHYKRWQLSFLIDFNYGGVRQSASESLMLLSGTSRASLAGREGGLVVPGVKAADGSPNDKAVATETYAKAIGGRNGLAELFNHRATNARFRELSIGYNLPVRSKQIKELRLSVTGRNLFFLYNACRWFDPGTVYETSVNGQGAENSFLPVSRTIGFNLKVGM